MTSNKSYDDEHYSNLKPIDNEEKYIEFDEEFGYWSVFGLDSGFCFKQFNTKEEAENYLGNK